jgi:NAD(P)-dependent dehydrogenase (short-subunit alcohol dehydrogenase family)
LQEFEDTLRINLVSSFSVLRAAAKAMSRPANSGGGSIVFCSSAVARHGIPNHEAIAAAKVRGERERDLPLRCMQC